LFFFGEKSIDILLERTGFKCLRLYKEAISLQLLLQKALWGMKDLLKDKKILDNMRSQNNRRFPGSKGLSLKRQLRLLYRYASHYLVRSGRNLSINGRPLKLLIIAEKNEI
jgi:hypothetical protein